eukprot:8616596-Pyramimonas_sp.AAC.1
MFYRNAMREGQRRGVSHEDTKRSMPPSRASLPLPPRCLAAVPLCSPLTSWTFDRSTPIRSTARGS